MNVQISEKILSQAGLSSDEVMLKIAVLLFQEEKLTLGQGSEMAGLHQFEFQAELAKRRIPIHYNEDGLDRDLETLGLMK